MTVSTPTIPDFTKGRSYDDPWEAYRWLRENDPVHWSEEAGIWYITRHADVMDISRKPQLYCNKHGVRPRDPVPLSILTLDDPEHFQQRSLINRGFVPSQVRRLAPHVRELAQQIVEDIRTRGEIDFVEEMAIHVPLIVIAELMGLEPEARLQLFDWSEKMMGGEGKPDGHPDKDTAAMAAIEFITHVSVIIEDRRANPKDDLISILTGAFDDGALDTSTATTIEGAQELLPDDLLMFLVTLLVAGNETTRNAISGGLVALSRFPEQQAWLAANPDGMTTAVDELIRYVSPVLSFTRTVTEDHVLHGKELKEGDEVLLLYQSANRDESVFQDADELKLDRSPNPHLAFGFGPHYCLGANLARLEVGIVFEELLKVLPDIRVAPNAEITRADNSLVLGIQHVPAVFTPR